MIIALLAKVHHPLSFNEREVSNYTGIHTFARKFRVSQFALSHLLRGCLQCLVIERIRNAAAMRWE